MCESTGHSTLAVTNTYLTDVSDTMQHAYKTNPVGHTTWRAVSDPVRLLLADKHRRHAHARPDTHARHEELLARLLRDIEARRDLPRARCTTRQPRFPFSRPKAQDENSLQPSGCPSEMPPPFGLTFS
jgi:hypothetical protein